MIIKLLLLSGLCVAALFAYRSARSARSLALRRVGLALILSAAVIGIAFPALVTVVANAVGVGRGADLVLYALVVVSMFVWVGVYRRLHDVEARFVELSRSLALERVRNTDQDMLPPAKDPETR
jgi:small membrane protein